MGRRRSSGSGPEAGAGNPRPVVLQGRYRLDERVGDGGMSVVWAGHDIVLDRPVAVKMLAHSGYGRSILDEAKAAASLSHPHVASVFDVGEYRAGGKREPFVVMELLRGESLAQRVARGPLDAAAALRIGAQVAGALCAAHERGIVHCDIKPGNVMLTASGAKVFDFGIAAPVGERQEGDPPVVGTAAYLAPERLAGGAVTPAADVYALALLLYRALTDRLPWTVETLTDMIAAHVYLEPDRLPVLPGVPQPVRDLVDRCLAKSPAERPSARAAAIVLAAAAGITAPVSENGPTSGMAVVPAPWVRAARRARRRFVALVGAAGVVAAAALAFPIAAGWTHDPTSTAHALEPQRLPPPSSVDSAPSTGSPPAPPSRAPRTLPLAGGARAAPPSSTAAAPAPEQSAIVTAGGVVTAACRGSQALLETWQPAAGWTVLSVDAGPGPVASVVFGQATRQVTVRATCPAGVLSLGVDDATPPPST